MRTLILFFLTLGMVPTPVRAQLPVITNQPASRAVWTGVNVTFSVGISGSGPLTDQWQFNGTNLPNGIITTVAGNGIGTYSGDGGPATNASLYHVLGVAVDAVGNLFIADLYNNRIRKVGTNGIITTVAGNGSAAYAGDGGQATNASLNAYRVEVDTSGDLFIVDIGNYRIREVDSNGIISSVAGRGSMYYSGDGVPATNAGLDPAGLAVDGSGNLFIADASNQRIREVGANGIIATVAGNGFAGVSGDGGPATNANLDYPFGVEVDASGNLYIAGFNDYRVRKVGTNGIITTVAGGGLNNFLGDGGQATNASLLSPDGVVVDGSGNLFISDFGHDRVREVSIKGIITTVAGNGTNAYSGDGGPATNASLLPTAVAVNASGNLFIADRDNNRVRKVTNTQGPALALNNATPSNAGNYQVVVTGAGGSVTSSVATLIVATSPLIYQTVPHSDGSVTLYFVSPPSSTNVVLCATNLAPPVFWQPLSTNVAGGDGDWQYTDTNAAGWQARFYRSVTH